VAYFCIYNFFFFFLKFKLFLLCYILLNMTFKPVLRGHLWNKEKWSSKAGGLVKEAQFIWNYPCQDKQKVTC